MVVVDGYCCSSSSSLALDVIDVGADAGRAVGPIVQGGEGGKEKERGGRR